MRFSVVGSQSAVLIYLGMGVAERTGDSRPGDSHMETGSIDEKKTGKRSQRDNNRHQSKG